MEEKDYYQILGIDRTADQKVVRESYRKLAFQYHPDRNKENPDAAEKMKDLNEAYAVLSDKRKRGEYDALRQRFGSDAYGQFRRGYSDEDIFRGSDVNRIFEEMSRAFGLRGFEEIFNVCYGEDCRTFEFRRPGLFGRGFIYVSPGFGRRSRHEHVAPGANLGRLGRYFLKKVGGIELPERGQDWHDLITLDPSILLEGGKIRYIHRRKARELMVSVPPGIREGQQIRLKGLGADGAGGGPPGDLYLKVRVRRSLGERLRDIFFKKVDGRAG